MIVIVTNSDELTHNSVGSVIIPSLKMSGLIQVVHLKLALTFFMVKEAKKDLSR